MPKDFDTPVEFRVNFSAVDAGDTNTSTLDYLSLDRISPVLDVLQPNHAFSQVRIVRLLVITSDQHKSKQMCCFTQYRTTRLPVIKHECTMDQVLLRIQDRIRIRICPVAAAAAYVSPRAARYSPASAPRVTALASCFMAAMLKV